MEKAAEKIFARLKEDLLTYAELKLELLKLHTYERVSKVIAILSFGIVLILLAFFTVLFLFLGLGFYLGELLNSTALGFIVVAGIYLIFFVIIAFFKERIRMKVVNEILISMMAKDDKDEDDEVDTSGRTDS
ncbi:phage holin family protein [Sanguibacteroides justesenii]|uniref:Phage holin family protein n=1 Tax=Sanguibacteroides justesenii TaxID=1547597 RepID=A0A0C3MGW8_9PORP|nr:phage holin family protein [Sanguibacteroides justesenii]KIO45748.1 hypothetical protein BA92_04640 [Sanguibacteroides justesenii]